MTLLDLFDNSCPDLFYSGIIIVEIRDLRRRQALDLVTLSPICLVIFISSNWYLSVMVVLNFQWAIVLGSSIRKQSMGQKLKSQFKV